MHRFKVFVRIIDGHIFHVIDKRFFGSKGEPEQTDKEEEED
jgi:hypothetical protein